MSKLLNCEIVDYQLNGKLFYKFVTEDAYNTAFYNETLEQLLGNFDKGTVGTTCCSASEAQFKRLSKMSSDELQQVLYA